MAGALTADGLSLFLQALILVGRDRHGAALARLPARERDRARRALRAAAVLGGGHAGPRLEPGARLDLRGARDHVGGALRPGRHRPRAAREPGGGAQVLRDGSLRLGLLPLRRGARLRRDRQHLARARVASPRRGGAAGAAARGAGRGAAAGGLRLQGRERAVPHVDARRLRGRPDHGDGLHVRRRQGRRLRRAPARVRLRARRAWRATGSRWWRRSRWSRCWSATWRRWPRPA